MKVLLLDGYSLMYRAYHALAAAPMSAPDGTPTTAVHGFAMMLLRLLEDEKPDRMAVAFDAHAKTFRHEIFDDYKGNRSPMPDDLRAQDPVIRELISLMGIPLIEQEGFEADDLLGTISQMCEQSGDDALIVTGDRDSFQLVGPHTRVLYTRKGLSDTCLVDEAYVAEHYAGLTPKQLIEVKSLMGDASDNIPGVSGVGEKTALRLIADYGDLENTLSSADTKEKGKLRERLLTQTEQARMSRRLAEIDRHVPLENAVDDLKIGDVGGALFRLRELGMNQVCQRLEKLAGSCAPMQETSETTCEETFPETKTFASVEEFRVACEEAAKEAKFVSVDCGAAFSVATDSVNLSLTLGGGDLLTPGVTARDAAEAAGALLNGTFPKYVCGFDLPGADDASLMAYCVNPQRKSFTAEALCEAEGLSALYAACPGLAAKRLCALYEARLAETGMTGIYREIELPLSRVLRDMEQEGFLVDADALKALGESYRARIAELVEEIAELAGERINLNSPQQLGKLLFEKLGLPAPKKTSRGYSTDAETLEALSGEYPICEKVLEYRKYKKLESTYIDALIRLRDEHGRVHTSFDQTSTATGRISSLEPNLQNIPVRTELGRSIRGAFVAREGYLLVDADYSQIELRVLAHMAGDEAMISAFNSGEDIHRRTAAEVRGISPEDVTPAMRSAAKAVNFGIVYGISDFTLAKNLNVSRAEARDYIDKYFARYPGVKRYLDDAVASAKEKGYARTLMGRRRYIPELSGGNFNIRAFGERCAMNSPIQGTAADIIKLAMIRVHAALRDAGLRAKLILQVHDELMVEAPEDEVEAVQNILKECMESVADMRVKLKTDISVGRNWLECK